MFTGLVECCGILLGRVSHGPDATFTIGVKESFASELSLGESVSVDGACLTVTLIQGDSFRVDASSETLSRTTLGDRRVGDRLHLERAMRLNDRLGGHLVSGHVDATGRIRSAMSVGKALELFIEAPNEVLRFIVEKGSITVDGISLTVNQLDQTGFSVVLIPHTQSIVHLADKAAGDAVNLEADLIGKYVERLIGPHLQSAKSLPEGLTLDLLSRKGFVRP